MCDSEMHESLAAGRDRITGIARLIGLRDAIGAKHRLCDAIGTPRSTGIAGSFDGISEIDRRKDFDVGQRQAATIWVDLHCG